MEKVLKLFLWDFIRIVKRTLLGRNRNRKQPESGRITKEDVDLIIEESLRYYNILKQKSPLEKTFGARLMLRNGIMSLALYRGIGKVAVGEDYGALVREGCSLSRIGKKNRRAYCQSALE